MGDNTGIHVQELEEAEESASLSDFPVPTDQQTERNDLSNRHVNRSSTEATDLFEFLSDLSSEMSHAEDIIFCGKLAPFKQQSLSIQNPQPTGKDEMTTSFRRRRSDSLSALNNLNSSRSESDRAQLARDSRSLDDRKLRRATSSNSQKSEFLRNSSVRSSGGSVQRASKPRWHFLLFGFGNFPREIDMRDMKNRQVRRTPTNMFPPFDDGRKDPVSRNHHRKNSWCLLKVLSCKEPASVAVTTASFACTPPA